jgi:predicted nucleic acid-binding protein
VNTLLDTSIWIPYLRNGTYAATVDPLIARGRVWLHSVVLFELYAGAVSSHDKKDIDTLAQVAHRLGRVIHPQPEDFVLAGRAIAAYAAGHGRVRPKDHSHDLLIAIGAGRAGTLLLTANLVDMRRWSAALARRAKLTVRVASPP